MNVLVTGGAGFIGCTVDALWERGHWVSVLDNLDRQVHGPEADPPSYLSDEADFQYGDVRDRAAVDRALRGMEVVFHQAAAVGVGQSMYAIKHYMEVNTVGTAVLLEAMVAAASTIQEADRGVVDVDLWGRPIQAGGWIDGGAERAAAVAVSGRGVGAARSDNRGDVDSGRDR